jgi:hypothetical protein
MNALTDFAAFGIRHAHDGRQGHLGMGEENIFHFPGVDVEAAHQDHVFFAVRDDHVSAFVHVADVAGEKITAAVDLPEHRGGFIRSVPVALHDLGTADGHFAVFSRDNSVWLVSASRILMSVPGMGNPMDPILRLSLKVGLAVATGAVSLNP